MSRAEKVCLTAVAVFVVVLFFLLAFDNLVLAADEKATTQCPTVGQPCKVLLINPQEEDMLTKQGGILDSAAAGRYLDLGNVASYFRMKLMQAPAGEIKAPPQPTPAPSASPTPPASQPADAKP